MIVNLWERMTHTYGHKWAAVFGASAVDPAGRLTDVAQTWRSGLRAVTGEQLAQGIRACIDSGDKWPPTLPAFRAMCLERTPRCHQDATERADLAYVALPRPVLTPEQRQEYLFAMRSALAPPEGTGNAK